ncbi:hypothetical protein OK016_01600 [Vibrio chagasii]|nr:hypothetical protein [Vibrio chagasii]
MRYRLVRCADHCGSIGSSIALLHRLTRALWLSTALPLVVKVDTPVPQRVFWAFLEGAIAVALACWVGGTGNGTSSSSWCFTPLRYGAAFRIILLLMCVSLLMGMRTEKPLAHKA